MTPLVPIRPRTTGPNMNVSAKTLPDSKVPDCRLLADYSDRNSGEAFGLLVARHASLVLGTCRRALRREADAEDARPDSVRPPLAEGGRTPAAPVAGRLVTSHGLERLPKPAAGRARAGGPRSQGGPDEYDHLERRQPGPWHGGPRTPRRGDRPPAGEAPGPARVVPPPRDVPKRDRGGPGKQRPDGRDVAPPRARDLRQR